MDFPGLLKKLQEEFPGVNENKVEFPEVIKKVEFPVILILGLKNSMGCDFFGVSRGEQN